jgi:tryptophan synthase alpha chain
LIRLATPTTDAARLPAVLNGAGGFLYYVSVAGITGMQQAATDSVASAVARLKANTDLPVAVGFGVRTPDQAAAIAAVADGVVVGSAIIDVIAQAAADGSDPAPAVAKLVSDLSGAVRAARKEKAA